MATEVIMPALNPGQETGIFLEWLKQEGDSIEKGEPLMEVETDKANVEVEAPATGILSGISVKPGDEIQVGKVMAMILADGDSAPVSIKVFLSSGKIVLGSITSALISTCAK